MTQEIKTTAEAIEADAMPKMHEVHSDPTATTADTAVLAGGANKSKSVAQ